QAYQSALYDGLWPSGIFGILLLLERRPRRKGLVFLTWAGLYTTGRIVTDFLRVDKRWVLGLTGSQITSIFAVLLCAFLIARYRGAPGAEGPRAAHAIGAPHVPDPQPKTSRAAPPGKAAPSGEPVSEEVGKPDSS